MIGVLDGDGVALVAIQGLARELKARDAQIARLARRVQNQQRILAALRRQLGREIPRRTN